jgi:hypothetical protein
VCLDHRFVDGYQAATMARVFREYLADPAAGDPVPEPVTARTTEATSAAT